MDIVGYRYPERLWSARTEFESRLCPLMYDLYEDIVVFSKEPDPFTYHRLLQKYKKIYLRTELKTSKRVPVLRWISPHKEKPHDSCFLNKQNHMVFYGDLRKVFYNPRYAHERLQVKELFRPHTGGTLGVVGAGIGPYSLTLGSMFDSVTQYQLNSNAVRFSKINAAVNLKDSRICYKRKYNGETHSCVVAVMPSKPLLSNLKYNFTRVLVFYHLCSKGNLQWVIQKVRKAYGLTEVQVKMVRNYSKEAHVYRITVTRC